MYDAMTDFFVRETHLLSLQSSSGASLTSRVGLETDQSCFHFFHEKQDGFFQVDLITI